MFKSLLEKLQNDVYLTLETTPSREANVNNILSSIEKYNLDKKVDGFSTTDNPLAKLKYNAILSSIRLQEKFQKPVIVTMSMRDKNKLAIQSDLLGANDFDIRAVLALTGDSAKISDQENLKGVFEANSQMLLEIIKSFNNGKDFSGKAFKDPIKPIYPFSVVNSYAKNIKSIQKKMHQKVEAGSLGLMTQPIYGLENGRNLLKSFRDITSEFSDNRSKSQLIFGIFPITSFKTAKFLANNVPGIFVPDVWIQKLEKASKIGIDEEYKVGFELSKNIYEDLKKINPKIHLMSANKFNVISDLIH